MFSYKQINTAGRLKISTTNQTFKSNLYVILSNIMQTTFNRQQKNSCSFINVNNYTVLQMYILFYNLSEGSNTLLIIKPIASNIDNNTDITNIQLITDWLCGFT